MTHWLLLACIALTVAGVAFINWPVALIVAGVLLTPWLLFREVKHGSSP